MSLLATWTVFGNAGTLVSFRVGQADAEVLEGEYGRTFVARQFVELEKYQVLVRLLDNGAPREPFRATTLPPLGTHRGRRDKLVATSRQHYTVPRATVEAKLERWARNHEFGQA